jgi:glycosyltransferase involved in cell wall biosynthesis
MKMINNIKIARISTVAFFVDSQLREQMKAIVEAGADLLIVASDKNLIRKIDGAKYISIEISREINLLKDFVALFKLWLLFVTEKFNIVHSTTPKAGLLCAVAGFFALVPVRIHTYTGQPWVSHHGIKRIIGRFADWLICKLNTMCYADSSSQRQFLIDEGLATSNKIAVIGQGSLAGVDTDRFNVSRCQSNARQATRRQLGIPEDSFVFAYVGRLSKDKGIFELLNAFVNIIGNSKCDNVYLLLIGPSELSEIERARLDFDRFSNRIVWTGYKEDPENFIVAADVLCMPSYREGFGTVVIEAAAMGIPAIGTNIYGLCDAILHCHTGILVSPRSEYELRCAMLLLLGNFKIVQFLGENAKERVECEFTSHIINSMIIEEYVRLLRG